MAIGSSTHLGAAQAADDAPIPAGAARSGRKTSAYSSAPSTAAMASEISRAGQKPSGPVPRFKVGFRPGIGSTSCPIRRYA